MIKAALLCAMLALLFRGSAEPADNAQPLHGTPLLAAPEASAEVVAIVKPGEALTPMAESIGAGGVKWFLVRSKSGATGWVKAGSSDDSRKVENFFKSLPAEVPVIGSSGRAPAGRGPFAVPVVFAGSSVIVPATFNQHFRANLLLDTGASVTMVSRRVAGRLSLPILGYAGIGGVGGAVTAQTARLQSLKVGEAEVRDLVIAVHDFHPDPRIGGLLGMDFLKHFQMALDAEKRLLVLRSR